MERRLTGGSSQAPDEMTRSGAKKSPPSNGGTEQKKGGPIGKYFGASGVPRQTGKSAGSPRTADRVSGGAGTQGAESPRDREAHAMTRQNGGGTSTQEDGSPAQRGRFPKAQSEGAPAGKNVPDTRLRQEGKTSPQMKSTQLGGQSNSKVASNKSAVWEGGPAAPLASQSTTSEGQSSPVSPQQSDWGDLPDADSSGSLDLPHPPEWSVPIETPVEGRPRAAMVDKDGTTKERVNVPQLPKDKRARWEEVWAFLHTLPSKADMEAFINVKLEAHTTRLETSLSLKLQSVKVEMTALVKKLESVENEMQKVKEQSDKIRSITDDTKNILIDHALHIMDLENRSRRANIRIRGLPESILQKDLEEQTLRIINIFLEKPPESTIQIDRVHRVAKGRSMRQDTSRDVICKLHHYQIKESILKAAWLKGTVEYKGSPVKILQDLAPKTLALRRRIKPVLEAARQRGADYRWGYPFFVVFKLNGRSFSLRSPDQLPAAWMFLGVPPIEIQDWSDILLSTQKYG